MATDWTTELKEEVIGAYLKATPTPENTTDIVEGLAEKFGRSVNGIRRILVLAQVYVTKVAAPTETGDTKPVRSSKADIKASLESLLKENNLKADEAILSKMTGKAMEYWGSVIKEALEG